MYCANWLKALYHPRNKLFTVGCNTSRKYTGISIFKVPKTKSEIPEHKNEKKNISKSIFFFHETMF